MTPRRNTRQATAPRAVDPAPIDPLIGTTIAGKYRIVRLIARGGIGLVYLARQVAGEGGERDVVVKVLAPNWIDNNEAVARFEREGQRLGEVKHANIVALLDCGREQSLAFMVMEYLAGELLSDYLARKGPLTLADFVPIAAQILKGIGFAHSRGLMHRDLKPSNIMLMVRKGRANFVKILDFGMAKLVEGEREVTSEQIVGTANYIAPEQIRGEPLDVRVDVYAIGILFYFMLSGRLPFDGESNAALLYKHVHEPPIPLEGALPPGHEVPEALIALIHRCLAKVADDRPVDANEMVEALIDACPASMFHLPLADASTIPPPASASLTGLAEAPTSDLLRTAQFRTRTREDALRGRTGPLMPTFPPVSEGSPTLTGSQGFGSTIIAVEAQPRPRSWGLVVGALAAVLTGGVLAAVVWGGGGEPTAVAVSGVTAESRLAAQLDQVEREILAGEFDKARRHLDGMTRDLEAFAGLRGRADAARTRIAVASTLALAHRLEKEGNLPAALSAYRDILAIEPHHPEASASVTRLTAAMQPAAAPASDPAPALSRAPSKPGRPSAGKPERGGPSGETRPEPSAGANKPAPAEAPAKDPFLSAPKQNENDIFLPVGGSQ